MKVLWQRPEVRSASWIALLAFIVLVPVIAGISAATAHAPGHSANISANWTYWVSHGGYMPWNIIIYYPRSILFALVLALAAGLWMFHASGGSIFGLRGVGGPPTSGHGEYGTARWRNSGELSRSLGLWKPNSQVSGIMVARAGGSSAWVVDRDEHILLLGSTGSGKSRRVILPSISVIGSAHKESMILTDPKGELYAHTADWLRSVGYEVVRIDLREPGRGSRWNPMAPVLEALANGRLDEASSAARDIAHAITFSSEGMKNMDPLWPQSTEALIMATILGIAEGCPPGAPDTPIWPKPAEKHMGSVYSAILSSGENGVLMDKWIDIFPANHPAYRAYGPVRMSKEQTRASILTVATATLSLWADSEVTWLTSAQDYDLAEPGRRPMAVFLVVPDERSTRYPLATLYLQQMMQALVTLADQHGGRLPVRVNFLLDEFANLPAIQDFDHVVTVARGRGIRLLLAIQDLAQLKARYEESAGTIKGNCNTWLYLLTSDLETAQEIAGKLGSYTTEQRVKTAGQGNNLFSRSLLFPDEIMRWPNDQVLLIQARHAPAQLPLPDLSEWKNVFPEIMERRSSNPPNWTGEVESWLLTGRPDDEEWIDPAVLEEGY